MGSDEEETRTLDDMVGEEMSDGGTLKEWIETMSPNKTYTDYLSSIKDFLGEDTPKNRANLDEISIIPKIVEFSVGTLNYVADDGNTDYFDTFDIILKTLSPLDNKEKVAYLTQLNIIVKNDKINLLPRVAINALREVFNDYQGTSNKPCLISRLDKALDHIFKKIQDYKSLGCMTSDDETTFPHIYGKKILEHCKVYTPKFCYPALKDAVDTNRLKDFIKIHGNILGVEPTGNMGVERKIGFRIYFQPNGSESNSMIKAELQGKKNIGSNESTILNIVKESSGEGRYSAMNRKTIIYFE